jgi:C-terminal processing protease CtpA/Prc
VTHVGQDSPADGKLYPLDELLRVDGVDVSRLEHSGVIHLIKKGKSVTLNFNRPQTLDPLKASRAMSISEMAPLLKVNGRQDDVGLNVLPTESSYLDKKVHIKRGPQQSFGFGIASTNDSAGQPAHVVSTVDAGSPADIAMLAVGDILISVNDESIASLPHAVVVATLAARSEFTLMVRRAQQRAFNKRASITKVAPNLRIAERTIIDVSCPPAIYHSPLNPNTACQSALWILIPAFAIRSIPEI